APLFHRPEVASYALAIKRLVWKSTASVGAQDGVHCRMHDDIGSLRQLLNLIGCRVRARRRRRIVAGVPADHDASGRSVHAKGGMPGDVSRPDCADLYGPG